MLTATHTDEAARQRALDAYHIVDTLPEAAYDDVARLASMLCETPIALVSLIDRDRQWFKANVGFPGRDSSRDVALCDHAIRTPGALMEVPDLGADARFVHNPFVTGEHAMRFYAGMPLVTPDGAALGTVCVMDHEPRTLSASQRDALAVLARLTMSLIEGHGRERMLERTAAMAPAVAAAASEGYTIALLELQDFAGAAGRIGERALEKRMQQLDESLGSLLRAHGDTVNRATMSPELVVVLQGHSTQAGLQRVRECVQAFEHDTGLRILIGAADARSADERQEHVFLRADEALSQEKDRARTALDA